MNPQDDPEARIRALEPTELGAEQPGYGTGYGTPPPLPPPTQQWPEASPYGQSPYGQSPYGQTSYNPDPYGYAAPYPTPQSSGSGFRPWMLIVPLMIAFLLIGGGAVAFWLYSSTSTPGTPGISGGGGQLTDAPVITELPDLPPIVIEPGAPNAPPGGTAEPGGTITVTGIGSNRSVTCDDNILIISGANNTVDVTGHCTAVTVSGFENVVTAESAGEITVSGFENKVTYRSGSPTISQSGSGNSIELG
ncbi:DUF3060 domain-containing protein [Mycobacterium sp. C31M]